jgi:hypothetical protein
MTLINNKRAVGVFSSHQEVEDALNELRDNGFDMNQVSVIAKHDEDLNQRYQIGETQVQPQIVQEPTETHATTRVEEGAKTGVEAGGAVGGLTGLLIGLGTLAIPGIGPIMLAGAAATAIATTLAGGLIGSLVGLGIPEHRAQIYHDYVVDGDYLVIVDGTEAEILRAETIFKHRGVREWEVYNSPTISRSANPVVSRV